MKDMVAPYYLPGRSQLAHIEECVAAALTELIARWWPASCTVGDLAITPVESRSATTEPKETRFLLQREQRWLAVLGADCSVSFAQAWLGCSIERGSTLAKALEIRFFQDLFCTLAGDGELPPLTTGAGAAQWSQSPGSGIVRINVMLGDIPQRWVTTMALWPFTGEPRRVGASTGLTSAASALGPSKVRLEVRLAAVQMSLADVAALSAGDFLNLQHDLSGQAQVVGTDIQLSLPAVLGRRGAHKAALIAALREGKK